MRPFFGDCHKCGKHTIVVEIHDSEKQQVYPVCMLHLWRMMRGFVFKSLAQTIREARPDERQVIMPGDPKYQETRMTVDAREIRQGISRGPSLA